MVIITCYAAHLNPTIQVTWANCLLGTVCDMEVSPVVQHLDLAMQGTQETRLLGMVCDIVYHLVCSTPQPHHPTHQGKQSPRNGL